MVPPITSMVPPPWRHAAAALVLVFLACVETSSGLCIGARRAPGGPARRWEESFDALENDCQRIPCRTALGRSL